MLPDKELVRMAAERFHGGALRRYPHEQLDDGTYLIIGRESYDYNPLIKWDDAGAIVEEMRADGFRCCFDTRPAETSVSFSLAGQSGACKAPCSPRAITIAALRAVGALEAE